VPLELLDVLPPLELLVALPLPEPLLLDPPELLLLEESPALGAPFDESPDEQAPIEIVSGRIERTIN
jgi:hypothetical protein